MMRKLFLGLLMAVLALAVVVTVNTLRKGSRQLDVPPIPERAIDKAGAAERLAEAVRYRTIASRTDPTQNADQFGLLHALLQLRYPKAHAVLKREVVNDLSLLYTWQGSDASLQPILLMAHQDVVPVSPGTESQWTVDAFAGTVKDGFVWGRGAWDNKGNLIAQLEAMEMLAASGFAPRRTILLAFGGDEEVAGERGAAAIAALLKQRGQGGNADNVLPGQVQATVNYRMLPGDSSADILARLKGQIARAVGSAKFELQALPGGSEASKVSPTDAALYLLINRSVREVFPGTVVAPGLMIGGTDSRHFEGLSDQIFRFSPVQARAEDLPRFHGSNERISVENLAELIRFYHRLLTVGAQAS